MSHTNPSQLIFRSVETGDELGRVSFDPTQKAVELYKKAKEYQHDCSNGIVLLTPEGIILPEFGEERKTYDPSQSEAMPILVEIAKEDAIIHKEMQRACRRACRKWRERYLTGNSSVNFPVNASITLLAAMGRNDLFRCSETNVYGKLAECTCVQPKTFDVVDSFHHRTQLKGKSKLPSHILVLLDYDKSCDQEIASLLASKLYEYAVNVTFLFTTPGDVHSKTYANMQPDEKCQCLNLSSLLESGNVDFIASMLSSESKNNAVIQLAPINEECHANICVLERALCTFQTNGGEFRYYIQKNSSKLNTLMTLIIHQFATQTTVVDVADRQINYAELSQLLGGERASVLAQTMWDFMIHVADPAKGREVAHQVTPSGRRYNLIKTIIDEHEPKFDVGVKSFQAKMNAIVAKRVVDKYVSDLMNHPTPNMRLVKYRDGSTNAIGCPKMDEIKKGYTFMLLALDHVGVPMSAKHETAT